MAKISGRHAEDHLDQGVERWAMTCLFMQYPPRAHVYRAIRVTLSQLEWRGAGHRSAASPALRKTPKPVPATAITTTAKPKARQHQPDPRERRRIVKVRRENFEAATRFAFEIGNPINVAVTINWTALIQAGERNEGHCLDRSEAGREAYMRSEVSRCRPRATKGSPFVAIWGRDVGAWMGLLGLKHQVQRLN